jgi:hypothetical protein
VTTKVEKSIQVQVPVSTAYNQWTQFEDFPRFMGGVQQVRQLGDRRLHWVAQIAGVKREWEATILEQVPDQKVAWAATSGATNAGAVRFAPAGAGSTLVYLSLEYEPEGLVERAGDTLGLIEKQVQSDLERFKELIEDQGSASGAWRGSVNEGAGVGTPGVEDAAASAGDSGKAGLSAKTVVAGVAAAAAGVAAASALTGKSDSDSDDQPSQETATVTTPITATEPIVSATPSPGLPVTDTPVSATTTAPGTTNLTNTGTAATTGLSDITYDDLTDGDVTDREGTSGRRPL